MAKVGQRHGFPIHHVTLAETYSMYNTLQLHHAKWSITSIKFKCATPLKSLVQHIKISERGGIFNSCEKWLKLAEN